jgi:hypothetical protein
MAIEIADIMKTLGTERAHTKKELKKLDKVIAMLCDLSQHSTTIRTRKRHKMSSAARRKIGAAQRKRWAKFRQQRANKD